MSDNTNDFPTKDLLDRYGIKRSALSNRLNTVEIKPYRKGNKSYITEEQLAILDKLDCDLQQGKKLSDFKRYTSVNTGNTEHNILEVEKMSALPTSEKNEQISETTSYALYPQAITKEVEDYFMNNQRLKYLAVLEELVNLGWGITNQEIKELLDVTPRGDRYTYDCFTFIRQGKVKNQVTWRVIKN